MKTLLTTALATGLMLSACGTKNANTEERTIDLGSMSGTPSQQAEALVQLAEEFIYTGGAIYVEEITERALKLDSTNVRAKFYNSLSKPLMAQKGIHARVRPLVATAGIEAIKTHEKNGNEVRDPNLRNFLKEGVQDIATVAQLQQHLREMRKSLKELRANLTQVKGNVFAINLVSLKDTSDQNYAKCSVKKTSDLVFKVPVCETSNYTLRMNSSDVEALRLSVGGYSALVLGFYSAYDMSGLIELAELSKGKNLTEKEAVELVKSQPELGKLVDPSALTDIAEMGREGIEALKWAARHQGTLCQKGTESSDNRPGFLFSTGFCVTKEAYASASQADIALTGPVEVTNKAKNGQTYTTYASAQNFLAGSLTDIKSILPDTFNECGKATSIPDGTVGGLFPRGDVVEFSRTSDPTFLRPTCP